MVRSRQFPVLHAYHWILFAAVCLGMWDLLFARTYWNAEGITLIRVLQRLRQPVQLVGNRNLLLEDQMSKSESISLTRILTGSPDRVFDAWINPSLLQQWLAPKAQVDAREGGHFRLEVSKPEGVHVVTGKYQEFRQNEHLVMTWVYDGPMGTEGDMEALLRVELRKHGSNTDLTLRHDKLTNPAYRETIAKGAWTTALDRLETLLAGSSRRTA